MQAFYCDHFELPLPAGHRFPMSKYRRLRASLLVRGVLGPEALHVPDAVSDRALLRAHDHDYVAQVVAGQLPARAQRRIGFPWSPELVERSRRSAGGTLAACRAALRDGAGVNLAGGTHHAFADHGEGFCVFNDAGVALRALLAHGEIERALIVDCDVHQGNGSASIFRDDTRVFTFSIHGRRNFPFRKETSDLDVALEDDTGDEAYLRALTDNLDRAWRQSRPDLVLYVAGADPFEGDRLGRLALSKTGLAARDRLVLERCRDAGRPVAVAMAGGYADDVSDIVDIHATTIALTAAINT